MNSASLCWTKEPFLNRWIIRDQYYSSFTVHLRCISHCVDDGNTGRPERSQMHADNSQPRWLWCLLGLQRPCPHRISEMSWKRRSHFAQVAPSCTFNNFHWISIQISIGAVYSSWWIAAFAMAVTADGTKRPGNISSKPTEQSMHRHILTKDQ